MSLDSIVNLSITIQARAPEQRDVGTPLLFGYHTAWLNARVRTYEQADEMLDDGFTPDHPLYLAARIVKSQNPAPSRFKIGRRAQPLQQVIEIKPTITEEGFEYRGTIGGKTLSFTVPAGANTTSIAGALANAINLLSAGCTAANETAASVTSSKAGPWDLEPGDTLLVAVDGDVPGSPKTATFDATAASVTSDAETFNLTGGGTLTVVINGGEEQTITFAEANFATPSAATAAEVAAAINAQILHAHAYVTVDDKVEIRSDRRGTASSVQVTGGTANAELNFPTTEANGAGDVADIDAVTFEEVKAVIENDTDALVSEVGGFLKLSSPTSGATSAILVTSGGTAQEKFGFDTGTHTGTPAGDTVTVTANAPGTVLAFALGPGMELKDVTADTTTDDELAAVALQDSNWYGLTVCDSFSKATALLSAAWTEAQRKENVVQTPDSDCLNPNKDEDVMSAIKAAGYARTGVIYHRAIGGTEWLGAGWLAKMLGEQAGSATPAFKAVAGVSTDTLKANEFNAILAKNGSHYTEIAGLGTTYEGKTGQGLFLDDVRGVDALFFDIQDSVFATFQNMPKVPFTDGGVLAITTAIESALQRAIAAGTLAEDPPYRVTAPLVRNVPMQQRVNRRLPDVKFEATLAGAIHGVTIRGVVSI